jgi:hypothetical protein
MKFNTSILYIYLLYMPNNFSNLNTATLFQGSKYFQNNAGNNNSSKCKENFAKRITVNTICNKDKTKYEFDSKVLLNNIHKRRKKLSECYEYHFKRCCETVISASEHGFIKIEYEIPLYVDPEYIGYSCPDCIRFIKGKLEENNLDVKILSLTKILIMWYDLEKKIEN